MSTPAGWYDDGSGRQRWWDGQQWTQHYAPGGGASPSNAHTSTPAAGPAAWPNASGYPAPAGAVYGTAPSPKQASTAGFIGLGLAVLGTILAFNPSLRTFWIAALMLLAAFVVSLIAVFKKNTTKWPAIVGICLSLVGGLIAIIVLVGTLLTAPPNGPIPNRPTVVPSPSTSEQPSDLPSPSTNEQPSDPPATEPDEHRPSPEAIAQGYLIGLEGEVGMEEYTTPEVAACVGQFYYDSEVSDELLRHVAAGEVITQEVAGDETAAFSAVAVDAALTCGPQPG